MIVLDTHIWVWWVDENSQLSERHRQLIQDNEQDGLGVSVISCWEVAKLVELGRLELDGSIEEWMGQAVIYPGIKLLPLTPQIAIESTKLPGSFHRDPADQIIVATTRVYDLSLLTVDRLILDYPHVLTLWKLVSTLERSLLWSLTVAQSEEHTTCFVQADFSFFKSGKYRLFVWPDDRAHTAPT